MIAEKYAAKYPDIIRFYRQEKNIGPTRSGYEMLLKCRGKYIASCEGDDYWCDDNKLQIQADFLDNHLEYSGCTHEMRLVDENERPLRCQKLHWISRHRDYGIEDFKGIYLPGHPNSTMRRNYYLDSNFDGSIFYKAHKMIGDRTNALVWASKGRFYRFPQVMGCYRRVIRKNAENLTSKLHIDADNKIRDDFEYTKRLEEYAENVGIKASFEHHKHELFCSAVVDGLFKKKDNDLAKTILCCCKNKAICVVSFPIYVAIKSYNRIFSKVR